MKKIRIMVIFVLILLGGYFAYQIGEETYIHQRETSGSQEIKKILQEHITSFSGYPMSLYMIDDMGERQKQEERYNQSIIMLQEQYDQYSLSLERFSGTVTYFDTPQKIDNLGLFLSGSTNPPGENHIYIESPGSYSYIGDIKIETGETAQILSVQIQSDFTEQVLYFIRKGGEYFFIPDISYQAGGSIDKKGSIEQILLVHDSLRIKDGNIHLFEEARFLPMLEKDFHLPDTLTFTQSGQIYTIQYRGRSSTLFSRTHLEAIDIKLDQIDKPLYREKSGTKSWLSPKSEEIQKQIEKDYEGWMVYGESLSDEARRQYEIETAQMRLFSSDAFFLEMPDHTTAFYALDFGFREILTQDQQKYQISSYNGRHTGICGINDGAFAHVPEGVFGFEPMSVIMYNTRKDPKKWNNITPIDVPKEEFQFSYMPNDLIEVGVTDRSEKIYFFKNKNHPLLRAFYKYGYLDLRNSMGCERNDEDQNPSACTPLLSYEEYREQLPIFFWKDPFGRIILFISDTTLAPSACGAKPVIYLYPEEEREITVTLDWEKKSLISIPTYYNGWTVQASPNGDITLGGKKYPYLFWEDTIRYPSPEDGFVVERIDLSRFFGDKLSLLGLSEKEQNDFIEYWLPHMQEYPYYTIHFFTSAEMTKYAPITITPRPDAFQRIFMDWKGYDKKITLPEQKLTPFSRTGYTVIEWGGKKDSR